MQNDPAAGRGISSVLLGQLQPAKAGSQSQVATACHFVCRLAEHCCATQAMAAADVHICS